MNDTTADTDMDGDVKLFISAGRWYAMSEDDSVAGTGCDSSEGIHEVAKKLKAFNPRATFWGEVTSDEANSGHPKCDCPVVIHRQACKAKL